MRRIFLALVIVGLVSAPAQARNHNDRGNGNANKDRSSEATTTTTTPTPTDAASGSTAKSKGADKSDGAAGKADGSSGKADGGAGKTDGAGKSDGAAGKADGSSGKPDGAGKTDSDSGTDSGTDSDADSETDSGTVEIDSGVPQTFIVRFSAGVSPDIAGKTLIDGYNDDVKKENAASRAEAARSASKERNSGQGASTSAAKKSPTANLKARGSFDYSFKKVLNAAVIRVPAAAVSGLLRNPKVLSIEKDASVSVDPTPVNQLDAPWGLDRIDQRALPLSNSFTSPSDGAGVSIYIVDTGIDAAHREFGGRVAPGFDAIDGTDGRTDCNSHGTHVAGTAGAATYGVAKAARLVPVRVLGCDGSGTYAGVIAGLDWIAQNRAAAERAVVNMSLGGGASSSLDSAVASLVASGVTVVVAAGNSNIDACNTSPARAASAITVGATTTADARASYSNFGSCLDIFGPGSNILSTTPNGGTATYSGTSMAAPHVAGVAAVVLSLRDYTPSALATYLTEVATTGVVSSAGTGSPNLLAYIPPASSTPTPSDPDPVATIPAQPDAPVGESRNKAVVVSWSIPTDGGAPISAQTVRTYTNGRLVSSLTVDGATSSTRVSRLRNGVDYTFTVQARNSVGAGLESAPSAPVRPAR